MDRLVDMGAEAIIVPAMDAAKWGSHEHKLNSRVGPLRAAGYGLPVMRVASSGVSQIIEPNGRVVSSAAYPGIGEMEAGKIFMSGPGSVPIDRWLGPGCTVATGLLA